MTDQNDINKVKSEKDFDSFSFKFYKGKNFFPDIKENINNKLVEYVKEDDKKEIKNFIKKKLKTEWEIPFNNFLTFEEQEKYNYNFDFLNVYSIYKFVKENIINKSQNKDFYDLMGYMCLNYFKNFSDFNKLKDLEKELYSVINFKKTSISTPKTEDDFFIYLYCLNVVDLSTFMSLKEEIENSDFKLKTELLDFLNDLYLDLNRKEKYINKILNIFQIKFFEILNEFIFRNLNIMDTLVNQYQNALFNERKYKLPKCETPDTDTYGIFDGSKKYYYLYSRGEKILLDEGKYRYNYIVNKNFSEHCGYEAIIFELEEDILNIFPEVNVSLSSDDIFTIKLFYQFINREIFEVMCEFPVFRNLQKELKNTKDTSKENLILLNQIIVDLLNLVCPIKNDNTIEYSIFYNMVLKLKMSLEKVLSYNTLENSLKTKMFLDKSEKLFKIFYNEIQEILATQQSPDILNALIKLQEEKIKPLISNIPIKIYIDGYEFNLNHLKDIQEGKVKGVLFYNCFWELDRLNDLVNEATENKKESVKILGKTFKVDTIKKYIIDANRSDSFLVFLNGKVYDKKSLERTINQTKGDSTIIDGKTYSIKNLKEIIQIITIDLKHLGCFNLAANLQEIENALKNGTKFKDGVKIPSSVVIFQDGKVENGEGYLNNLYSKFGIKNKDNERLLSAIKNSDLSNKSFLLNLLNIIQNGGNLNINNLNVSIDDLLSSIITPDELDAANLTIGIQSQENLLGIVDFLEEIEEFVSSFIFSSLNGINLSFLNKIASLIGGILKSLGNLICQILNVLGKLFGALESFLGAIASLIGRIIGALNKFLDFIGKILDALACAFSLVVSGIDLFQDLVAKTKQAINFIKGVGETIESLFNNTPTLLKSTLQQLTSLSPDSLSNVLDNVKDAKTIEEVTAIVKNLVGKNSGAFAKSMLRNAAVSELDNLKAIALKDLKSSLVSGVNVSFIEALDETGISLPPETLSQAQKNIGDCANSLDMNSELEKSFLKALYTVGQKEGCSISSLQDIIGESPIGFKIGDLPFIDIDSNLMKC